MGRSPKIGLDYFRLDVHLDDKFKMIEAEFGLKGFAVVVKLYQKIYGEQGYYCEWNDDVALVFGKEIGLQPGANAVSEIVTASIKRRLFDKGMFDKYHILTSNGIQERYFEAVERRERVEVIQEYLLVSCDKLPKNVNIKRISVDRKEIVIVVVAVVILLLHRKTRSAILPTAAALLLILSKHMRAPIFRI